MKKTSSVFAAMLASVCIAALAQDKHAADSVVVGATAPGKATMARTTRIKAIVETIDVANRKATLRGPRGNAIELAVGPEVRNLDKVKVGDLVMVDYLEELNLTLKKDGKEVLGRKVSQGGARSKAGEPLAGAVAQQIEVTADVTAVDTKKQLVTLRGPEQTIELKVRDPEQLKLIKVGDQVQAVYTETLALRLEPARTGKN